MTAEARMGRPPKKISQLRRNRVVLLFTDEEMSRIEAFIEHAGYEGQNHLGRESILEKIASHVPIQTDSDDSKER